MKTIMSFQVSAVAVFSTTGTFDVSSVCLFPLSSKNILPLNCHLHESRAPRGRLSALQLQAQELRPRRCVPTFVERTQFDDVTNRTQAVSHIHWLTKRKQKTIMRAPSRRTGKQPGVSGAFGKKPNGYGLDRRRSANFNCSDSTRDLHLPCRTTGTAARLLGSLGLSQNDIHSGRIDDESKAEQRSNQMRSTD